MAVTGIVKAPAKRRITKISDEGKPHSDGLEARGGGDVGRKRLPLHGGGGCILHNSGQIPGWPAWSHRQPFFQGPGQGSPKIENGCQTERRLNS